MPILKLNLKGDSIWPELVGKEDSIIHLANDAPAIQIATLDGGMASGKPSVTIRVDLPDGKHVLAETSARVFCTAARAIMAKYPDLFND
jgi:hypothetical protein